jgi:transcriptional regulator with XRE-family HTH domain
VVGGNGYLRRVRRLGLLVQGRQNASDGCVEAFNAAGQGRGMIREPALGENVRRWRLRRGYSQAHLAGLADISINVVRKLEQGNDTDGRLRGVRLETLYKLARALDLQTARLFSPSGPDPADQDPAQRALLPIRVALTPPLRLEAAGPREQPSEPDLVVLRSQLDESVQLYHQDRYDSTALVLPELIASSGNAAACSGPVGGRAEVLRLSSGVMQLAGRFLTQVGAHDLAYQAIRQAIADAHACGDRMAAAAGVAGECWLFIRQGRLLDAKRTAADAADRMEPRLSKATADELSAWGWLLLRAAAAAVRNNQEDEAREFLRLAKMAATGLRKAPTGAELSWTILAPATVAMKEVEHQVVIGNWRHALTLAERIPRTQRTLPDDRHRHELDLAKAHAELADYSAAIDILAALHINAPHWLRHQRLGRQVTRKVLTSRTRALPGELRALADFFDLGA